MASPYTYGAATALTYGPGGTADHISALANGSAVVIDWNNLSGAAPIADINYEALQITVAGAAGGTMTLFGIASLDGTIITDGILSADITGGTNVAAKIAAAPIASVIATVTSTQFWFPPFSMLSVLPDLVIPQYCGLVLLNSSGGAVATTSGSNNAGYKSLISFA